jgi:hypothetical protein
VDFLTGARRWLSGWLPAPLVYLAVNRSASHAIDVPVSGNLCNWPIGGVLVGIGVSYRLAAAPRGTGSAAIARLSPPVDGGDDVLHDLHRALPRFSFIRHVVGA